MFTCKTCFKVYGSKATLSRHERNHRDDARHRCTECNVTFRRRDLLNRHLQIHDGSEAKKNARQRCHTACQRCKAVRCRCNGAQPCGACVSAAADCLYTTPRWRTSEREAPAPPGSESPIASTSIQLNENHSVSIEQPASITSTSTEFAFSGVDELDSSLLVDDFSAGWRDTTHNGPDNELMDSTPLDQERFSPSIDTNLWPFLSAWQWTHQDSFFQGGNFQSLEALGDQELLLSSDHGVNSFPNSVATTSGFQTNHGELRASNPLTPAGGPTNVAMAKENAEDTQVDNPASIALELKLTINAMVDLAKAYNSTTAFSQDRVWVSSSARVRRIIGEDSFSSDIVCSVFIDQYFDNFHPLWPLVPSERTDIASIHPLLYLTLTSIGALYSRSWKATYGSFLHKILRSALVDYELTKHCAREEALDIGKAMLLTQVAALYFEQEAAFSAAERLGASLLSIAHRMRLFTTTTPARSDNRQPDINRTNVLQESQRMLVYGMLRAETYLSVLFNRKPRLSYEEINLSLPLALWTRSSPIEADPATFTSTLPCGGMLFSDLVRIALDKHETLPTLHPVDLELLMFGLQHDVWRFSNDPKMFDRFDINTRLGYRNQNVSEVTSSSSGEHVYRSGKDPLDFRSRNMADLKEDHQRVFDAFKKWKQTMQYLQRSHGPDQYRSTYLSGLILHEISLLRMCAPVEAIQQVAYQVYEPSEDDQDYLRQIYVWTCRSDAPAAVEHAASIWHLLNSESNRNSGVITKYNIMALIALHHAAAVIWAIAGSDNQTNEYLSEIPEAESGLTRQSKLCRSNNSTLMHLYANVCLQITASWGIRSSFAKMILRLAENPLPPR